MRDDCCPDCRRLTAGDCGKHGPAFTTVISSPLPYPSLADQFAALRAENAALRALVETLRDQMLEMVEETMGASGQMGVPQGNVRRWIAACEAILTGAREGAAGTEDKPCRVCGGSGFVAQKQFIDDGYGEVDACPACSAGHQPPPQETKG